jgi:hypothetical protein
MAIYVWRGPEPDLVFVVNKHRIRTEHRETYEAPEPAQAQRALGNTGPFRQYWYLRLADGNH